jgi:excisionase family DNA binding protein
MKASQKKDKISRQLDEIQTLLKKKDDKPLNFVEAAKYLSLSHSSLYKLTYQKKIRFYKPSGKLLYFFKHELDEWITKNSEECRVMSDELKDRKRKKRDGRRENKNNNEDSDEPDG